MRKVLAMVAVSAALITMTVVATGPSSGAGETIPIKCEANGLARVSMPDADGLAHWTVEGSGICSGDFSGNYRVELAGSGTSKGISQCSGDAVVQDLALDVEVRLRNLSGERTYAQTWTAPLSNYSARTPFIIGGDSSGLGAIGHHLFLACPGFGNDSASFVFSFTAPQ
jgi:hypothetical protein